MTKKQAIKKLEAHLNAQYPYSWNWAGCDYQNEIMAAEDALECLLGRDSIRTPEQALKIAINLK